MLLSFGTMDRLGQHRIMGKAIWQGILTQPKVLEMREYFVYFLTYH